MTRILIYYTDKNLVEKRLNLNNVTIIFMKMKNINILMKNEDSEEYRDGGINEDRKDRSRKF